MSQLPNITIVILAAGASTRMGTPKQLLKWGGTNLLQHTIHIAKNTIANNIIIVLGAHKEAVFSEIKDESITIIVNEQWSEGLGTSIACAADFILNSKENSDGVLIVLADQPFVNSEYLNKMIYQFSDEKSQIIATLYSSKKKGVPVVFAKKYFKELSQISGDDGAKSVINKYNDLVKTIIPDFKNVDIDTLEEYKKMFELYFLN